jgi:hypothetical protein
VQHTQYTHKITQIWEDGQRWFILVRSKSWATRIVNEVLRREPMAKLVVTALN